MNPHQAHPASPRHILESVWRNRSLIWQMTRREIASRYRGSLFGVAWSFINPLLMLTIYTFVFSVVFRARWGVSGDESRADFAMLLFAGMIVYNFFAECVNRAPGTILSNINYVKKVVFPLEILPWVTLGTALFNSLVSVVVLMLAQLFINQVFPWTSVFFPLIMLPVAALCIGLSWVLASLGVFVRDIGQFIGIFTTIVMFLSPVFYPVSALPEQYQVWLRFNPLTPIIEEARNVLIFGRPPSWMSLVGSLLTGLLITSVGFWWFQKTRKGFADVI